MRVPTTLFLDNIESLYSVKHPSQYRKLCAQIGDTYLQEADYCSSRADFISDIETFWSVNVRVGRQQWGDYERAIIGKEHPKDKNILWGGILPFFFNDDDNAIFGFSSNGSVNDDAVLVWRVHMIVYSYHSLFVFTEKYLSHCIHVQPHLLRRIRLALYL